MRQRGLFLTLLSPPSLFCAFMTPSLVPGPTILFFLPYSLFCIPFSEEHPRAVAYFLKTFSFAKFFLLVSLCPPFFSFLFFPPLEFFQSSQITFRRSRVMVPWCRPPPLPLGLPFFYFYPLFFQILCRVGLVLFRVFLPPLFDEKLFLLFLPLPSLE